MRNLLLVTLCLFPVITYASDYPSQSDFYKSSENLEKYNQLKDAGMVSKQRQMYSKGCMSGAKTDADKKQCECASEYIKTISDKDLYYESYISYKIFQDMVAAKNSGDKEKEAEIVNVKNSRNGLEKKILAHCSKK